MNRRNLIFMLLIILLVSCEDKKEVLVPFPNDITFNELELEDFSYIIPDNGGFKSDVIKFNTKINSDGTFSGFAYSNRNNRSFTWQNSKSALDTNLFSVYTARYNRTETFVVASVKDDDAFFILSTPTVIEHVLFANTTYDYLGMNYGDQYGSIETPVANPNIKAAPIGIWYSNVNGGIKEMIDADEDYFKIIIDGYNKGVHSGKVEFYLCSKNYPGYNEDQSFLINDWFKCDLSSLGVVDKVVFHLESSDVIDGVMRTPPYFCMDGIRLKRN